MRFAILIVSIGALLGVGAFMYSVDRLERALLDPAPGELVQRVLVVAPDTSAPKLLERFEAEGLVGNEGWLSLYAESLRDPSTFVPGEYALNSQMSPVTLFERLQQGRVIRHTFSFEPGVTAVDVVETLTTLKLGDAEALRSAASNSELLKRFGVTGDSLEGFLYPDIYGAPKGLSPQQLLGKLTARFAEEIAKYDNRSGHPLYEVVTVASLIEMSEVPSREQRMYAALLYNRLAKRLPLDHPHSAAYGQRKGFGVGANPYDTKRRKGLPPTPICNPGPRALQAAFNPLKTDAVYKVKREDGSHYYCPDRACALAAERARKGLTPIDRTVRAPPVAPPRPVPEVLVIPGRPFKPEPPSEFEPDPDAVL